MSDGKTIRERPILLFEFELMELMMSVCENVRDCENKLNLGRESLCAVFLYRK